MSAEKEADETLDESKAVRIPDSIRKVVTSGLSALWMTEEGIRQALGDMRLPKDAITYIIQQTERSRRDLFRATSEELRGFLKNVDVTRALRQALSGLRLEVNAQVRIVDEATPASSDQTLDPEPKAERPTSTRARAKRKKTK